MTIQQQIQDLAQQIAELSAQIEQAPLSTTSVAINYEQLKETAQKYQFTGHPVYELDEYVKTVYMQTLLSVLTHVEESLEKRLVLAACIADSIDVIDHIQQYMTKAYTLTESDIASFVAVIKEHNLIETFSIDVLMLVGIHKEAIAMKNAIDLLSTLNIRQSYFIEICQFTNALLSKDYNQIYEFTANTTHLETAASHYLSMLMKNIYIEGEEKQIELSALFHPIYTEKIYIKNAHLKINQLEKIADLKVFHLEDCQIHAENLWLFLKDIESVVFKNVIFDTCEGYRKLKFLNIDLLCLEEISIKDLNIDSQNAIHISECNEFIFKNNVIENNTLPGVSHHNSWSTSSYFSAAIRGSKRTFISAEDISKRDIQHNIFVGNKYGQEKLEKLIN